MKIKTTTLEEEKALTKNGISPATAQGTYVKGGEEIPYWTFEGLYRKIPSQIYDKENHSYSVALVKEGGMNKFVVIYKNKNKFVISESENLMQATVDCVLWLIRNKHIPKEPEYRDFTSDRQSVDLIIHGLSTTTATVAEVDGVYWSFETLWSMLPSEFDDDGEHYTLRMMEDKYSSEKEVLVYYAGKTSTDKRFFSEGVTAIDALVNLVKLLLDAKCIDGEGKWVGFSVNSES